MQGLHSYIDWCIFTEITFIWFKPEQYQIRKENGLPPKHFLSIKHHSSSTTGTNKPTLTIILKYNDSVLNIKPHYFAKGEDRITLGILVWSRFRTLNPAGTDTDHEVQCLEWKIAFAENLY